MTENNLNEFEQDPDIPFGLNYQKRQEQLDKEIQENFDFLEQYHKFRDGVVSYVNRINKSEIISSIEKIEIIKDFRQYYEEGNSELEKEVKRIMDLWNEKL